MQTEYEYDHNAAQLDRQLEEVMDSHQTEQAAQAKEAEALSVEPPALDRLLSTTKDQVNEVKSRGKEASVVLQEEIVRDRLREYQAQGPAAVDGFLKEAGLASGLGKALKSTGAGKSMAAGAEKAMRATVGAKPARMSAKGLAKQIAQKRMSAASIGKQIAAKAPRRSAYQKGVIAGAQTSKAVRRAAAPVKRVARQVASSPAVTKMHGAISGFKRGFTGR